jgi:exodeoxyribonuclease VII large subunit
MESITLTQLTETIKEALTRHLDKSYWVVAEISEIRLNQTGHCYLELIEKEGDLIKSKIKATIWSYNYRNISAWFESLTGSPLMQGMNILANVQVSYHEVYGLSLNIKDIDPNYTLGERERKIKETIKRLMSEGVFDMNKMNILPDVLLNIGVISSSSSAGYGDFMDSIVNSKLNFEVTLYNATLQGDKAAHSIIKALYKAAKMPHDVVVIIRGGGAQIDLETFNDFDLCNHIAQFPLPIITGIGHERDETISDMVAHTSLKTPTAVAEMLIDRNYNFIDQIYGNYNLIIQNAKNILTEQSSLLREMKHQLKYGVSLSISEAKTLIRTSKNNLNHLAKDNVLKEKQNLIDLKSILKNEVLAIVIRSKHQLSLQKKSVSLSNPEHVLQRGFTITRVNGKILNAKTLHQAGDVIETQTNKLIIRSTLINAEERNG